MRFFEAHPFFMWKYLRYIINPWSVGQLVSYKYAFVYLCFKYELLYNK